VDIAQLQQVNNKFMCTVDFWLDIIVVGFVTKFVVDTANSYSAVEKEFLKGPRGRYIISLYTSIKILLYKKGVLTMEEDNQTSLCAWGKGGSTDKRWRNRGRYG